MPTTKYFFGYHQLSGLIWPFTWITEGGITVGGHPLVLIEPREITEEEYNLSLVELARRYPRKEDTTPTLETG